MHWLVPIASASKFECICHCRGLMTSTCNWPRVQMCSCLRGPIHCRRGQVQGPRFRGIPVQVPSPGLESRGSRRAHSHARNFALKQKKHTEQMYTEFGWKAHTQSVWQKVSRGALEEAELISCEALYAALLYKCSSAENIFGPCL
jgi:hypothetical protein